LSIRPARQRPRKQDIPDIDDTFCAARGAQQLAIWNAHHDERGFEVFATASHRVVSTNFSRPPEREGSTN
jgi:hypothetical protein